MRIGLDFDGVISDCGTLKSVAAKTMFGVDIPPSEFKKELVVNRGLLTMPQYRELQNAVYGTWEYGKQMQPVPGVTEAISFLRAGGHALRVLTSRDGEMLRIAREWTIDRGIALDPLDFQGIGHGKSKADAAVGLDIFIDDDLDKLKLLVGVVPHLFLFSWGYNDRVNEGNVARRVASWREFIERISEIAKAR